VISTDRDGDGVADIDVVEFTDPVSSMVYRAAAFDEPEHAIGHRMLTEAKAFAEGEWQDASDALELARGGGDQATIDAAEVAFARASNKLNEKVQIIDFMVYLGNAFEFPGG
jgi:hypothetical protein